MDSCGRDEGNRKTGSCFEALCGFYGEVESREERGSVMHIWLSIIIPVYNTEKYIENCLNSIVQNMSGQTGLIEVIIIDDGSTDSSGMIADKYANQFEFFRVLHQRNQGVAKARNIGMKSACGEWLYFMDPDDWLEKKGICHIFEASKENEDADIILFDAHKNVKDREEAWEHFSNNIVWQGKSEIRKLQREVLYFNKIPMAAPWDKVYKHSFLKSNEIQFHQELKVLDDMVFNVEAFGVADKVAYCKEKIYHYRYVPDSITNGYKPDRVEQDGKVWNHLQNYMAKEFKDTVWQEEEREAFRQAYYCRVIKSFSICCRLYFFNKKNEKRFLCKIKNVKEVLLLPAYKEAFRRVKMKNAEWRLKIVILMGRIRTGLGIYLLHLANTWQVSTEEQRG